MLAASCLVIPPGWIGGGGGSPTIVKVDLLPGYYFWLASNVVAMFGIFIPVREKDKKKTDAFIKVSEPRNSEGGGEGYAVKTQMLCPICRKTIEGTADHCPECGVHLI
ncbi:hypothetical protein GCM10007860_29400 [Chitiniphilus shinanonensis]|uniref:Zinc ribbon domain-containing protein n=1 Tax=Chitiniphilus shinanonensis TaxID=553088 RepID=A0ABQ6BUX0_9NEIS|nr:hypothetical protein GCM10007860_29400 [Chitiniphilus shinanonensis]